MSIRKRCIIKVLSVRTGAIMTSLQCHCNSQEPLNAKSEVKSNKGRSFFHIESCIPLRHTEQSSLSRHWILLPWALRVGEVVETSWSYRLSLCWQCLYKVYDEHGRVSPVTGAWALVSRGMSVAGVSGVMAPLRVTEETGALPVVPCPQYWHSTAQRMARYYTE